ncbi:hypothetical protein FACS1894169_07880 [Bacteroidia bacterium]|nr:hypothetical protein FACS1894169_07880 [Bacteroidia bacterium]
MAFKELNIIEPVLMALNEKGYTNPTPLELVINYDLPDVAETYRKVSYSIESIINIH